MESNGQPISEDAARFLQLVAMFQMAAMQQMGKQPNALTNEIERDLQQAKASIDVLEMLERKTEGNLSEIEREFLEKALFELRMNYVDEAEKAAQEETEGDKEGGTPGGAEEEDNSGDEGEAEGKEGREGGNREGSGARTRVRKE